MLVARLSVTELSTWPTRRLLWALLAAGVLLFAACSDAPLGPEDQVRAVIDRMEKAVEGGAIRQAAALMHDKYSDRWHPDKRTAVRSLMGYTRRHSGIHLFSLVRSVEVSPDDRHVQVTVYVAMTGVPVESVQALVSLKADLYRFDVRFVRGDADWQVSRAEWQRADLSAL